MIGYVALGSNVGDSLEHLRVARHLLNQQESIKVLASSQLYATKPYGGVAQDDFLNVVLKIETSLSPIDLLAITQGIEKQMGRVKTIHWGPRNIDVDILLLDSLKVEFPHLTIPHKEITKRSFVLIPLADVYEQKEIFSKSFDTWINATGNREDVILKSKEW